MVDSASYLGTGDMAFSMPGAASSLRAVGSALIALRDSAAVAAAAMTAEATCFSGQIGLIAGAQAAISAVALASLNASIAGSLSASAALGVAITDPTAYVLELTAAVNSVLAVLAAGPALPTVTASLESSLSANLDLKAEAADIVLQISALTGISLAASACVVELLAAESVLAGAVSSAGGGISVFNAADARYQASPSYSFVYEGTLSGMGAALNAVTPSSGVPGTTLVRATVQVVRQADATPIAAQAALLRTT